MYSIASSSGGWPKSLMRTELREQVYPLIPEIIRNSIKEVTKTYFAGSTYSSTDTVFIPSIREIITSSAGSMEGSGPRYLSIFTQGSKNIRHKLNNNTATGWWTRTATGAKWYRVGTDGTNSSWQANNYEGVLLLFCT